jgi:hypothetical protein
MPPVLRMDRAALVLLLTTIVGAGSAFAPEHVHERDDHHAKATVHRHLAPHHGSEGPDHARLDDDDDHVIWLATAWLQVAFYHGPDFVSTPAVGCSLAPATARWTAIVLNDTAPPHGPPRISRSLRAPPFPA